MLKNDIILEKFKIQAMEILSKDLVENMKLEAYEDYIFEKLCYKIRAQILGEVLDEIKYPSDWWQAFKER